MLLTTQVGSFHAKSPRGRQFDLFTVNVQKLKTAHPLKMFKVGPKAGDGVIFLRASYKTITYTK